MNFTIYAVIDSPFALGAVHDTITFPLLPSIAVVTATIYEGLDAATIETVLENSPLPH
jgi:hypothetical protein